MTAVRLDLAAPRRYTGVAIFLHWTIAALMAANLALVWFIDDWPDGWVRPAIDAHKSIGITVLGLVLLRILWRFGHAPPPLPAEVPPLERRAASIGHIALYIVMFALPLTGWMHDSAWKDAPTHPMSLFWLAPWPRIGAIENIEPVLKEHLHDVFFTIHQAFGYALYVLFVVHVGAALKHQWWDRQRELQRMLP